jgi:hypothetical protein
LRGFFIGLGMALCVACGGSVDERLPNGTVPGLEPAPDVATAIDYGRADCAAMCAEKGTFANCIGALTCNGLCDNDCLTGCLFDLQQVYESACGIQLELYNRCVVDVGEPTGCDSLGVLRNPSCDAEWDALTTCSPQFAAYR